MFKVKKNFSCNTLRKSQGDKIESEEVKIISEFIDDLIKDDIIEKIEEIKPIRKKRTTKKKVI